MWVPGSPGGPRLARGQPVVSVRGWGGGAAAILAPGEAGARLGWGLEVLRLLRTRPSILRAGVTSHLGKIPRHRADPVRGRRRWGIRPWRSPPWSTALALVAAWPVGGGQVGLHLGRCFRLGLVGVSQYPCRRCRLVRKTGLRGWS